MSRKVQSLVVIDRQGGKVACASTAAATSTNEKKTPITDSIFDHGIEKKETKRTETQYPVNMIRGTCHTLTKTLQPPPTKNRQDRYLRLGASEPRKTVSFTLNSKARACSWSSGLPSLALDFGFLCADGF